VGAVGLAAADRQPAGERAVELGDRVEAAAGDDMVADNVDLSLHPALPGRPVGGQHIDAEAVMVGERGRLRVQRHRRTGRHVAFDDGFGAVVDDRARDAAEMGERSPVAVPEVERKRAQHAETDLHVRSYGERHMRLYADNPPRRHPTTTAGITSQPDTDPHDQGPQENRTPGRRTRTPPNRRSTTPGQVRHDHDHSWLAKDGG
jgi:hypothetical protein